MYISSSQIAAAKVFDSEGNLLGRLAGVHFDLKNGKILAFEMQRRGPRFISPRDILIWKREYLILGQDYEISAAADLVRLAETLQAGGSELLGKRVRTEGGVNLGHVYAYTVHSDHMVLSSITVQKNFLGMIRYDTRLIHQGNIIEIKPKTIIVKETWMKLPARNSPQQFALRKSPTLDQA